MTLDEYLEGVALSEVEHGAAAQLSCMRTGPPSAHANADGCPQNMRSRAAARLMSAIDAVREVVSTDTASDAEVADAVLYYSFDVEQAVTWLLDQHGRAAVRRTLPRGGGWGSDAHVQCPVCPTVQ